MPWRWSSRSSRSGGRRWARAGGCGPPMRGAGRWWRARRAGGTRARLVGVGEGARGGGAGVLGFVPSGLGGPRGSRGPLVGRAGGGGGGGGGALGAGGREVEP